MGQVDNRDQSKFEKNRQSFVGTPLYVAPEMLEFNLSGLYTDLWALGCIIYSPFHAKSQYEVFKNILERRIVYPESMDPHAVDLIEGLLNYIPE
jgi:serine/threonine protein kinase